MNNMLYTISTNAWDFIHLHPTEKLLFTTHTNNKYQNFHYTHKNAYL
jgi:hypothetical protein